VPAVEHAFLDPVPEHLYVDTDIFVNYLIGTQPHHVQCRAFVERLKQERRTSLYVSSLSWLELAHVFSRPGFRDELADDLQRRYRIGRWERPDIRRAYLDGLLSEFESVLAHFTWIEVPVTPIVRRVAVRLMADYGLGSQDAVHLASAAHEGVADLASFDAVYRKVDDLNLWNDLIHGTSRT
jgi:predicted nucleic acid-binding protein